MDSAMSVGLQDEIIAELTTELQNQPTFSPEILAIKVINAIKEVKMKRNYKATSFTDDEIKEDLYNYYTTIKNVALYDYAQIGAPFEISHNENSINRSWVDRDTLFKGVHAFVQIL